MAIFKAMHVAVLAAAASLGSMATAQDFQQDWEGFYAGLHLDANVYDIVITDLNNTFLSQSPNPSVLIATGGLMGGYNYALQGNLLIGAELDFTSEMVYDEFFASNLAETTGTQYSLNLDSVIAIKARAAFVQGNALSFLSIGVASAAANMESYSVDTGDGINSCEDSICARTTDDILGLTLGAGAEWAFRENWIGRVELQHYAFESVQAPVQNSLGNALCGSGDTDQCTVGYTPSASSIKFGISYMF
ncbi:outer membrane protein [Yoonia vestfoldensis]|uniref:outer membrane protein n=1 Tax=Yoonia vestfoldensis TaxID=245188 RepID=UPI00036FCB67|nr:outer membrane beta-barrel protein [Yoonia vestfoldensis]